MEGITYTLHGYKLVEEDEYKVWEIIRENPGELGFILQEKNYQMYCDTFNDDKPILTEEQYNLVKDYFTKRGFWYEDSNK